MNTIPNRKAGDGCINLSGSCKACGGKTDPAKLR